MKDLLLPDPDITFDLARLGTDPPSAALSSEPSSQPTPEPTKGPTSSQVVLIIPEEEIIVPPQDLNLESSYSPTWFPTVEVKTFTPVQNFYSCPPPEARTVEARDADGNDVIINIPPPISTVSIPYDFQVQMLQQPQGRMLDDMDEMMGFLLPKIQSRLGENLGDYMKSNTENGDDEDECGGFHVEDFRTRRKLNEEQRTRRRRIAFTEEEVPTRIIDVSSVGDLEIDENRECYPQNDGCYVVQGALDATYVGFNEAGVKSSISRAVKEEINEGLNDSNNDEYAYQLNFLGSTSDEVGQASTAEGSTFTKILGGWEEAIPEPSGEKPTPIGAAILALMGTAFCALLYILFVKSEVTEEVRNDVKNKMGERKEKKRSKATALGDNENRGENATDESFYSYDLESVAIDDGEASDDGGVEVRSTHFSNGSVLSGDSARTRKMSNRANEMNYANAQKLDSLIEHTESEEEYTTAGNLSGVSIGLRQVSAADAGCSVRSSNNNSTTDSASEVNTNPGLQGILASISNLSNTDQAGIMQSLSNLFGDATSVSTEAVSVVMRTNNDNSNNHTLLVDRTPSLVTSSSAEASPTTAGGVASVIHQLPSICEADGLPPPMNDTPHIVPKRVPSAVSEGSQQYEV